MSDSDGGNSENGNAHGCDAEADYGRPRIASGKLSQMDGKYEIPCTEKHAEQCKGCEQSLFYS